MPDYSLRNLTESPLPICYLDGDAEQQNLMVVPRGTANFSASALMPETLALIKKGFLRLAGGAEVAYFPPRVPNTSFGLSYVGVWGSGTRYTPGNVLYHSGTYYLVKTELTATTVPPSDETNYGRFAIEAPESFFGIEADTLTLGQGLFSDGAGGWVGSKVTDVQVDTIGIGKITDLTASLDAKLAKAGGTMTGFISLHAAPTAGAHAATKTYVDLHLSKAGGTMTGFISLHAAPTDGAHAATKNYVDLVATGFLNVDGSVPMAAALTLSGDPVDANHATRKSYVDQRLLKAGGTMTGFISLHAAPTDGTHAATKTYVDLHLPKAGGTMTGFISLHAAPTAGAHAATKTYVDTGLATKLNLAGGTLTGHVLQASAPTVDTHLVNKLYVDDSIDAVVTDFLLKAGGTMTGFLTLHASPTASGHAATKGYVDAVFTGTSEGIFLPVTGGTMTGPIDGDHGLYPLTGGELEGVVILPELPLLDGVEPRSGLFRDDIFGRLAHDGQRLVTEGQSVIVSDNEDYTVGVGVGNVLVANIDTTRIFLTEASNYSAPVRIEKIDPYGTSPVIVDYPGGVVGYSELILSDFRQSVTLRPTEEGWRVESAFIPLMRDYAVAWYAPSAETSEVVTVAGKVFLQETLSLGISAFSNVSGNLGIAIPSGSLTKFAVGETITVRGSGIYDGDKIILSKTTVLVVAGTFTSAATGMLHATVYSTVSSPVRIMAKLSQSLELPFADAPENMSVTATTGSVVSATSDFLMTLETASDGTFTLAATNAEDDDAQGFWHHLSAGSSYGNVYGERATKITGAGQYQASFTSVTAAPYTRAITEVKAIIGPETTTVTDATADDGGIWATVATTVADWRVGMTLVIVGSDNHDGEHEVLEVDTDNDRVRLDFPWDGTSPEVCSAHGNWAVATFTAALEADDGDAVWLEGVADTLNLLVGDTITITSTSEEVIAGSFEVLEVDPENSRIKIDVPYEDTDDGEFTYDSGCCHIFVSSTHVYLLQDPVEISDSANYDGPCTVIGISQTPSPHVTVNLPYDGDDTGNLFSQRSVLSFATPVAGNFAVGDRVTIVGSSYLDGTYTVQTVDEILNQVGLTARHAGTSAGVILNISLVELFTPNAVSFTALSSVRITGVAAVSALPYATTVISVSGTTIRVRAPFDSGEDATGVLTHVCSKPLTWAS